MTSRVSRSRVVWPAFNESSRPPRSQFPGRGFRLADIYGGEAPPAPEGIFPFWLPTEEPPAAGTQGVTEPLGPAPAGGRTLAGNRWGKFPSADPRRQRRVATSPRDSRTRAVLLSAPPRQSVCFLYLFRHAPYPPRGVGKTCCGGGQWKVGA